MIKIELVENQEVWDTFLTNQPHANILQSWAWGDFQFKLNRKIWRIGIFNDSTMIGVALAQLIPTKLRTHIYVSNGPVIANGYEAEALGKLMGYLKALGIQEKVNFVRVDPLWEDNRTNRQTLKGVGLKKASTHVQAEYKWILDISPNNATLLNQMKKNTRYEIKKAEKEGVVVRASTNFEEYDLFELLFMKTVARQKFVPHPYEYYKTQFKTLLKADMYKIYIAQKGDTVLATALIATFGDSSFYLHAASLNNREANKLMAPQTLVWHAIQEGKAQGVKYFDFWGVAKDDNPKDQWAGFTRFKKGFGGELFKVVRAHDLPLTPAYALISVLEATRELWGGIYYKIKR
ncbi:peptidoglycan bridge formation glycyltransferase FemA/FemB family protein [bacterium]|nr:peptidoglycan bridge formation glycyltransferase FemA/FemB family protein [bacterium]